MVLTNVNQTAILRSVTVSVTDKQQNGVSQMPNCIMGYILGKQLFPTHEADYRMEFVVSGHKFTFGLCADCLYCQTGLIPFDVMDSVTLTPLQTDETIQMVRNMQKALLSDLHQGITNLRVS